MNYLIFQAISFFNHQYYNGIYQKKAESGDSAFSLKFIILIRLD